MIQRRKSRLSPEFALLGFLHASASYGYELHRRLVEQFGSIWHASQSQTYNILKRLEAQGYLSSTVVDQEKLPARQLLQLTTQGKERFIAWLETPTNASVHAIRVEFITRLYFIRHYYPERTNALIQSQINVIEQGLIELNLQLADMPSTKAINVLAVKLRIELLNSMKHWLKEIMGDFSGREGVEYE